MPTLQRPPFHTPRPRRAAALLCAIAALAIPAVAAAKKAPGPWDGRWTLTLQGPHGAQSAELRLRGVSVTQTGERLTGSSIGPGPAWSLEIEIVPGAAVGLAGISVVSVRGDRSICAARVDRGVFSGTCYGGQGEELRMTLAPSQLATAPRREEQPYVAPPQPAPPVVVVQTPPVVVVQQAPPPPPSCNEALLAKGHHPMHLKNCKGAEPYCAVAMLNAGHHPMHLKACSFDLEPMCAQTLIAKGHAPMHLSNCRGVNPQCAQDVLNKGHHPMHLKNCR